MKFIGQRRIPRLGGGLALAVAIAISTFSPLHTPVAPPEQPAAASQPVLSELELVKAMNREAGSIHIDAVKRSLEPCMPAKIANETGMIEGVWRMPASGLTYYINTASIPVYLNEAQFIQATQAAAAAWTAAGAPALVYGGTVSSGGLPADGKNVVGFSLTEIPGVASLAVMRYSGGVVTEADIFLDITNLWSTNAGVSGECGGDAAKLDMQNTLSHEFGHWVGAKHVPAKVEYLHRSMFPELWAGELQKRTLRAGDIASIPPQDGPPSGNSGETKRGGDDDG